MPIGKDILPTTFLRLLHSRKGLFYDYNIVVSNPPDQVYFWSKYYTMVEEFFLRPPFYDLLVVVRFSTSPFPSKLLSLEAGGLDDEDLIILILSFIYNSKL